MEILLDIIKVTVPALIVFFTVYFTLKQYTEKELALRQIELQKNKFENLSKITVPLKLTAYERLALFCERISLNNLILRLPTEGQSAAALRVGMMLAIQQEYEHNMSQQVYISDNLWKIIQLAKDDTLVVINGVYEKLNDKDDAKKFAAMLSNFVEQRTTLSPLQKAQVAIRKEASLIIN